MKKFVDKHLSLL